MEKLYFSIVLILSLVAGIQAQQAFTIQPASGNILESQGTFMVTVTRTCTPSCPSADQEVRITADSGASTATVNADYSPVDVRLNFAQADTMQTFTVNLINDNTADSMCLEVLVLETLELNGMLFTNLLPSVAVGDSTPFNIADANPNIGTVTFAFAQANLGLDETNADFTRQIGLTRTCTSGGCPCAPQVARVMTVDGTAMAGSDYTALPLTDLTFEPTDATGTTKMFNVMVTGDTVSENDETFTVTLVNVDGTAPSPAVTTGVTIRDNDITCTAQAATKKEDQTDNTLSVNVMREGGYSLGATCTIEAKAGTATTDDYTLTSGNVLFAATADPTTSSAQANSLSITIINDNIREETEMFNLCVTQVNSNPVSPTVNVPITIEDDDAEFGFVQTTYSVLEGATCSCDSTKMGVCVTIDRMGYNQRAATVFITTAQGTATANTDFPPVSQRAVTFNSGEGSKEVCIEITNDDMYETNEMFTLTLSDSSGREDIITSPDRSSTTITIMDNDAEICVDTSMTYGILEDGGPITVQFKREGNLDQAATIMVYTMDGTATVANSDYTQITQASPQSVTFDANSDTATTNIVITQDITTEPDETFTLKIITTGIDLGPVDGNPNNDVGGCDTVTITIRDDDPEFGFKTPTTYTVREGAACSCDSTKKGVCVTLERTGYAGKAATLTLSTTTAGVTGTAATSGLDFPALTNEVVTVPENINEQMVCIEVTDDIIVESDEMFKLMLASTAPNMVNIITASNEATITIQDNDATISIRDASTNTPVEEGARTQVVTFERAGYLDRPQTFLVSTVDKTVDPTNLQAMSGTGCVITTGDCDFETITNQAVTFPSGSSTASISIQINNDIVKEPDEKFKVKIESDTNNPESIDTTKNEKEFTIKDDDACVYLINSAPTGIEGEKVTLTLGREPTTAIGRIQSVFVGTREIDDLNGRATSGSDFADRAGLRVTFDINEETTTVQITLIDDEIVEQEEKFVVFIFNENECIDEDRKETIVTIQDNDAKCTIQAPSLSAPPSEAIGAATTAADRTVCFSVYRDGATNRAGTCDVKTINSEADLIQYGLMDANVKHIAMASNDFFEKQQTISFQIGEAAKVGNDGFCVTIRDDDVCELPEKLYAVITNTPTPFDKFTQASSVTILDDSPERFQFVKPFNFEANEGEASVTITVYRCGDTSLEGRCRIRFESETAQMGRRKRQTDFNLPSTQELVFPPGAIEATVNVPIVNDEAVEGAETFRVIIEAITGDVIPGDVVATVTILDDDSFYSLELPQYSVKEGNTLVINVIRNSNYLGSSGSVDISTKTNVVATEGTDFPVLQNQTVTFSPNQRVAPVSITIPDDQISEFTELFEVYLSNPDGALVENFTSAIVSILDNDDVYYQFEDTEYRIVEAAGEVKVSVERYGSLENTGSVRVEFREASYQGNDEATLNVDFTATDTTVNFPPGDHTAEAYFRVIDDIHREDLETFGMFLADPPRGEYLYSPKDDAIVYIADNDENPRVEYKMAKAAEEVDETIGTVNIVITRVSDSSYLPSGSAEVTISESTAREGQDFVVSSRKAFFGENDVEATLPINIISSPEVETNEIFSVILSRVEGGDAQIVFPTQTDVTIVDHTVAFNFEVGSVSVSESQRTLAVAIQRTGNTQGASSVGIVSVSGTATDGQDYETVNARVAFDSNSNKETYQVSIIIDTDIEDSETFNLRLVDPSSGAVIGGHDLLEVTIIDSTARPPTDAPNREACFSFGQNTYNVDENDGKVYFTIRREGLATSLPGRVRFYTQAGNADPGRDYTSRESLVYFEAGVTIMTVEVEILRQDGDEDREFFTVHITDPEGGDARICNGVATVNIRDVKFEETLTTGIIIAIAVSGIFLILLLLAFLICICFRPRPRERENVIMMKRQNEPDPQPIIIEPDEPMEYIEPEPEPVTVIKQIRVPVRVRGPPPNGLPSYRGQPLNGLPSYGLPPPGSFGQYGPSAGPYGSLYGPGPFGAPGSGPARLGYGSYGPPPPY